MRPASNAPPRAVYARFLISSFAVRARTVSLYLILPLGCNKTSMVPLVCLGVTSLLVAFCIFFLCWYLQWLGYLGVCIFTVRVPFSVICPASTSHIIICFRLALGLEWLLPSRIYQLLQPVNVLHSIYLKLKFSQYPSIHTNYIISHCTTL